jgi:N-acylethanolamine-hydrolysing acid amidase
LIEKEFSDIFGSTLTAIGKNLVDTVFSILANSGAAYLEGELRSIAKSSGIGIGLLLLVQLSYELCAFCTSLIAQDENGVPFHVRTMVIFHFFNNSGLGN